MGDSQGTFAVSIVPGAMALGGVLAFTLQVGSGLGLGLSLGQG